MSQLRSARGDDAQHESNDEIFDDLLEKHPEGTGKIGRTAHATKGLVKPYWARRLKNRDVRASPMPGVCVSHANLCVDPL